MPLGGETSAVEEVGNWDGGSGTDVGACSGVQDRHGVVDVLVVWGSGIRGLAWG